MFSMWPVRNVQLANGRTAVRRTVASGRNKKTSVRASAIPVGGGGGGGYIPDRQGILGDQCAFGYTRQYTRGTDTTRRRRRRLDDPSENVARPSTNGYPQSVRNGRNSARTWAAAAVGWRWCAWPRLWRWAAIGRRRRATATRSRVFGRTRRSTGTRAGSTWRPRRRPPTRRRGPPWTKVTLDGRLRRGFPKRDRSGQIDL